MRILSLIVCSMLLVSLAACGGSSSTDTPPLSNGGGASNGGQVPPPNADSKGYVERGHTGASSEESIFPVEYLNDGRTETAWGALSNSEDVYAYVTPEKPPTHPKIRIQLFSPSGRNHLNEIRVIARNGSKDTWTFIRSRLSGAKEYSEKITVPKGIDGSTVTIELDPSDTNGKSYQTYGIACLKKSKGDVPNYLGQGGTGVYLRELSITE